jgi:polyisoprenoid-binding protein YceI
MPPAGRESKVKKQLVLGVFVSFVLSLAAPSAGRAADIYALDMDHTSIVFGIGHANLSLVYGFFRKAYGGYELNRLDPTKNRFRFSVDVASIDTNNAERDAHLLRADFFDATKFPRMTFDSISCTPSSTREGGVVYNVLGDLTIHGVTRRVTLPMRMLADGEGAGKKDRRTGFLCQFELKRSDYGMTNVPLVGDAVGITISFEGILQPENMTARRQ